MVAILGDKDLSKLSIRVQRFKLRMLRYDYSIFHTAGGKMYLADTLSRPNEKCQAQILSCSAERRLPISFLRDGVRRAELRAALEDETSRKCFLYMANWWPRRKRLEGKLSKLFTAGSTCLKVMV